MSVSFHMGITQVPHLEDYRKIDTVFKMEGFTLRGGGTYE